MNKIKLKELVSNFDAIAESVGQPQKRNKNKIRHRSDRFLIKKHKRLHEIWDSNKSQGILNEHKAIIAEMSRRGYAIMVEDDLDKASIN